MPLPCRLRPRTEVLEDRTVPSVMTFDAADDPGPGPNDLVLRLNESGNKLLLLNNGIQIDQAVVHSLDGVLVTSAAGEATSLTLDYQFGVFVVPVTFDGTDGAGDAIKVSADADFTLTNSSLTSSAGSPVTLINVERAELTGGTGPNIINATNFNGTTKLDGGAGNDTLYGGHGIDELLGGAANDTIYSITGGDDRINGGSGNDTYLLDPGSTITVTDDGGEDTIDLAMVSSGGVTATVGATSGTIDESPSSGIIITSTIETVVGTAFADVFTAANTTLVSLAQAFIGGAGDDTFIDQSTAEVLTFAGGSATGTPLEASGNDTYVLNPGSTIVVIDDGGTDQIDLSNVTSGGSTVTLGNTSGTATTPTGTVDIQGSIENVVGTAFADVITGNSSDNILAGGPGSDTLSGGAGSDYYLVVPGSTETIIDSGGIDTLDFSAAHFGITLNMTSSGSQVIDTAGNRIELVGTIENVIGSAFDDVINGNSANNVLVGGGGDDRLSGHTGRDILIGGLGSDRLIGGADEDILIGGTTSFDNDIPALLAIQAEWTSSRPLATRVDNLRGVGTGPRLNGDYFLKASGPGQTVFDDFTADTLTGSQQADWFFLLALDEVTDQNKNEPIN